MDLTGKKISPIVAAAVVLDGGTQVTNTEKEEIESSITQVVSSGFRYTEVTPLRLGTTASSYGIIGGMLIAGRIMDGTSPPHPPWSHITSHHNNDIPSEAGVFIN